MIILVLILLFLSFFQSSVLVVDLVFLVLICLGFLKEERSNYYLAFTFGLLISLLMGLPLGSLSLVYLGAVKITSMVKAANFSSNWTLFPLTFLLLALNYLAQSLLNHSSFNLLEVLPQIFWVLPIFFIVKYWEARFIPQKDIRLKIKR